MSTLLIFGPGYSGRAVVDAAPDFEIVATTRTLEGGDSGGALERRPTAIAPGHGPTPVVPGRDPGISHATLPGPIPGSRPIGTKTPPLTEWHRSRNGHGSTGPDYRHGQIGGREFGENDGPVEPDHDGGGGRARASRAVLAPMGATPGTTAQPGALGTMSTLELVPFGAAEPAIATATHILVTAAPTPDGDPVLLRYAAAIAKAPRLRWIGYLSSTAVYGNRDGAWVDEDTPPAPTQPRGQRRLDAESAWSALSEQYAVDIIRLAGIYGPGRSAFDDLRAGTARRMIKPGHQFGRVHRDDIGRAVAAAMRQEPAPGRRVLNLTDDVPAESAEVVAEAARLMGIPPPPAIAFADAAPTMSPMALSFWAENRKVRAEKTQQALGSRWLYPSFREGLAAIWRQESSDRPLQ